MTRSGGPDEEIWGTREELLLACAVRLHGTQSWESVAMEVQARSPFPHLLTAQTCRRRYHDIQRRFAAESRVIDCGEERGDAESGTISLLEELRRLRVAELRREVERYDVSIGSLQLKVKRLKEDREQSLQEDPSGDKPDPPETQGVKEAESPAFSPGNLALDRVSDGGSGRLCNESNSTAAKESRDPGAADDVKFNNAVTACAGNDAAKMDPAAGGDDDKVACEGSYNGSSDTVAKGAEAATTAEDPANTNPVRQTDAGESGESVAESKGEAPKESSDVQSSASLSRQRGGRRKAASGRSSGGDEAEGGEVSPASKRDAAKSQPLASFLQVILSHKHGSVFERRLESQESARYRILIRQHVDLGTVQSKMEEGAYARDVEFYRDLLLLCTNAVVFFPKSSVEYTAGVRLRELVRKQIQTTTQKLDQTTTAAAEEPAATPPPHSAARQPVAIDAKMEPDPSDLLLDKSISAPPLVACRKRSSISGKAAANAVAAAKEEEKPDRDKRELENTEKRTRERSAVVGMRGLRTSKGRGSGSAISGGAKKNSTSNSVSAPTENAVGTSKTDRKNSNGNAANPTSVSVAKKRSAVNFLTRLNRGRQSSNGTLLETLKTSGSSGKSAGGDQKRGGRMEGRRDQGPKQGSGFTGSSGKQAHKQSAPPKRSVGRPPKRPPPPLPLPPAKRVKGAEANPAAATRAAAAKKRGRR